MRQLGFWAGRPAPRKSAIFALQDGKIPDSPPRGPALRGPRRRGVWGGSPSYPPPLFPGLLGPLEAAVGGLAEDGQTPRSGPRLGTPRPHTFPPPRGLPSPASPCRVYAGIPGDPPQLHAGRPPLQALPGSPYARRGTFAKVGTRAPGGGGVREPPFGAPVPNEPPGTGAGSPLSEQGLPQDSSFGADQDGRGGAIGVAYEGI